MTLLIVWEKTEHHVVIQIPLANFRERACEETVAPVIVTCAVLAKPGVREQMQKHGFMPRSSTPQELAAYLKDRLGIWKTALRAAGMEPQ